MIKGYKARLYPNRKQETALRQTLGCCRFVYNHFLAERVRSYKEDNVSLSYNRTASLLTELKRDKDHIWLNDCDSMALQESLRDLDRAYQNFFAKRAKFPRFHAKKDKQSYRTRNQNNGIRLVGSRIKLPKIGTVRYRGLREFDGRILNATVSLTRSGKFYVSLCVESEDVFLPNSGKMTGIDVGIKEFLTESDGHVTANPKPYREHLRRLKREQRKLSRKQKGSRNREKQRLILAKQHEKVSNFRKDFLHKETSRIANENQVVCIEDLNIKGMLKNHRLAGSIADASWSEFYRQLEYKTAQHGGILVRVPRNYASSQTCSVCGYKNERTKDLSVRQWECPECGTFHDRDVNAALNILNKGLEILAS